MNKYWGTKCTLDRLTHLFDDYNLQIPREIGGKWGARVSKKFTKAAGHLLSAKK